MIERETVKLSKLRGIDKLEGVSEEIERIRKESGMKNLKSWMRKL